MSFFYYRAIAKKLGAKGAKNRAQLPKCVLNKIAELPPDTTGTATKVGYKQAWPEGAPPRAVNNHVHTSGKWQCYRLCVWLGLN